MLVISSSVALDTSVEGLKLGPVEVSLPSLSVSVFSFVRPVTRSVHGSVRLSMVSVVVNFFSPSLAGEITLSVRSEGSFLLVLVLISWSLRDV